MDTAAEPATIPPKHTEPKYKIGTLPLRIVWVMVLRVVLISVLLGATVFFDYQWGDTFSGESPKFLLYLVGASYFLTIIYAVWHRAGVALRVLATIQLAVDLIFWACITYATGGIISGFTFLFDLWVIVAAVLLGSKAAFASAAGSVVILATLVGVMSTGVLLPLPDQAGTSISTREYVYFLSVNVTALFVVAGLVNSLVARIEATGHGLEIERKRRADLAQLHEDMIRSLAVGIATTNNVGEILMMNPAGLETLKIRSGDAVGQTLERWLPDSVGNVATDSVKVLRGKSHAVRADENEIPIEYVVAPLVGSDGSRRGSIVAFSDQSEVRRLEEEVERSRRLAALGELAASLAHEIRNPLGAVSGSFQILAEDSALGEENLKLADIISRELRRMERLVTDMLNYARPRQKKLDSADMGKLVEETVKAFSMGRDSADLNVSIETGETENLLATVDHQQIRQVLWNLLRNAAQAIESGGQIDIVVVRDGSQIIIEVRDSGSGIPKSDLQKIFDPFYSTREMGIGLGLALCKRIVEEHGGEITASSKPSGGSVFNIALPADNVA